MHRFNDGSVSNDGINPRSIIQGFDGNFYGVTSNGGTLGGGAVYEITVQGVLSLLYSFNVATNASIPSIPLSLIQGADGNFYGTTSLGQIFRLTPTGNLSVLYSFGSSAQLNSLVQGFDGNFYGTTLNLGSNSSGTAFKLTPLGVITVLHTFGDGTVAGDGILPNALIQATDGNFYGTCQGGGTANNGTVFKMTPQGSETILHSFGRPNRAG